jgi:hypothetical protein
VATLVILRGSTPDREIEIGERTLRLGRGDQNDVVLPDPAKSVSRFHAELRTEQGRFIVVDLNSQNGVWIAGRRVPQATLEPGVPVVLGTYQLILKPEPLVRPGMSDATVVAVTGAAGPPSATMVAPNPLLDPPPPPLVRQPTEIAPMPVPLPVAPPKPVGAQVRPASPGKPVAPPKPVAPVKPASSGKPAAPARSAAQAKPLKPAQPGGRGVLKWALIGVAAVLLLVAVIAAVMLMPVAGPRSEPAGATRAGAPASSPAATPRSAGPPAERPTAPRVEPPPVAAAPARPPAAPPRATTLPPPPSSELPPAVRPAAPPPRAQPVGRRGAAPPAAEPKAKGPNLALAFEEARAAINRGDYPAAVAGLESILSADPGYPKAADLLDVARSSAKSAAKTAVDAGGRAEAGQDYADAERQYERALQADPQSTAAQEGLRRVKARMLSEGEDAFKRARQYDALGRVQEAITMYEKAIQMLPSDHASLKIARERLAVLKGGVER